MIGVSTKSNLDLINDCDNFPYFQTNPTLYLQHVSTYYHLRVSSRPETTLGYLLPSVALTLSNLPSWDVSPEDSVPKTVTLVTDDDEPTRSLAIAKTTASMRETGHFAVLTKWRNELYPVYGPDGGELLFTIERSASVLFGVITYGVHMTAFVSSKSEKEEMQIWVPRRSATKQTFPSMLDQSVAGGLPAGEDAFECLVREAMEEASLPEELVRRKTKAVGSVTYFYIRDSRAGGEIGLPQPECQYIYDLDLTGEEGVVCAANDDEVEGFELLGLEEVKKKLREGEFMPNCAIIVLDFLIRHGYITRENEKDYVEICSRMHRRMEFPLG